MEDSIGSDVPFRSAWSKKSASILNCSSVVGTGGLCFRSVPFPFAHRVILNGRLDRFRRPIPQRLVKEICLHPELFFGRGDRRLMLPICAISLRPSCNTEWKTR